ncbi:2-dehydropantoate 2-reductase [Hydrogenophaga luteola]|uniref:2-dehydropantoate 2-reductase n=1 Tax=Hydrogenophaga luteola TaxID=1591122 RepID=A0ABV7W0N9_9BURK
MSEQPFQKVAIVGVGAIGGLFAGWLGSRLPAGQIQLSAVARGDTLHTLQEQGLTWVDADGAEHTVPVHASDDPASLGVQDLVVVSVKGPAMPVVAPAVRALMGPHTVVLVAMNGVPWWFFDGLPGEAAGLQLHTVDPGGVTAVNIPTSQVIGCVVHASAAAPQPARIERIKNNQLIIGEPAGGVSPRVQALADLLGAAGFAVTVSERIQRDIWFKLWGNMTMNPVSAITGAPCDRILDDDLVRGFCSAVMREAQAIGARIGIPIEQSPEDRHGFTRKLGSFKTSMLQDVEAGRPIELDALVGAVREIGQHLGEATPNMDALMGLTRLMGQMRGLYPEPTKTPQ